MADLKIIIPQDGITLDDDKFITLTGDSGTTGIDISLVENTPGGSFESLTGFPLTSQSLPKRTRGGSNKTSIDIPIEFPSVGEVAEKTYLLTATGSGGAMMGPHTAAYGELSSKDPNNSVTMNFVQYKDPTIRVRGIIPSITGEEYWIFTDGYGTPAVEQTGKALTSVDSLRWRSDARGNVSVDFEMRLTRSCQFSVVNGKQFPVGWDSNDDNDNVDSDFYQTATDHGNVVEIHSLEASVSGDGETATLIGTIDFTSYGTKDVDFSIRLVNIFNEVDGPCA